MLYKYIVFTSTVWKVRVVFTDILIKCSNKYFDQNPK